MLRYKSTAGLPWPVEQRAATLGSLLAPYGPKLAWFSECGYKPHTWQLLFHSLGRDGRLLRFRHLAAGRRGGKTLSAAWEMLYYLKHPAAYWWDFHGVISDAPLWTWCLTKDYPAGRPALLTFRKVLTQAGLRNGVDYKEHRGERYFEFPDGSLLEFKTVGDDPEGLRGAGLHLLWMDEAAFIPNEDAWNVVRPALVDNKGGLITTTTPKGRNWLYEEFFAGEALEDDRQGSVEYRSIDNPYIDPVEIEYERRKMHPMVFKQEYEAMFDALLGADLHADWLRYYNSDDLKGLKLDKFIGVDPAISLRDKADRFAMTLLGVDRVGGQVFVLKQFAGRIPFPDQIEMIREWHAEFRPMLIGIEGTAYQAALVQQAWRISSMPPVSAVMTKGKKFERILAMSPLFKVGRVKILPYHRDFIDEWIGYKADDKNPKDDVLDSVELALGVAGVILPEISEDAKAIPDFLKRPEEAAASIEDLVRRSQHALRVGQTHVLPHDEDMGGEW